MTWEETIKKIRTDAAYADLVRDAYFDENLSANVERFRDGREFKETLNLIRSEAPGAKYIADIGSGNGIATIAFALNGFFVTSVEPDESDTIGAGAIKILARQYKIDSQVKVVSRFGEDTGIEKQAMDVVYIRQAMHHANDLKAMMHEAFRILKPGGLLMTVRDHVVFDAKDKARFFKSHPLHKFYGGENAYTESEYRSAMLDAGFRVKKVFRFFDSPINYFPLNPDEIIAAFHTRKNELVTRLNKKIGLLASVPLLQKMFFRWVGFEYTKPLNERAIAGRMYTFLATKDR